MPITVQGAGGETFQFPDGTDAGTIQRVLQKHYVDVEAAKAADIARKDSILGEIERSNAAASGPLAMIGTAVNQALRNRVKSGAAVADFAKDDNLVDRAGALLERGYQSAEGGLNRFVGTTAKSDVLLDRSRRAARVANVPVAGKIEWENVKTPSDYVQFGLETGIESLPEMAITATPFIGVPVEAMIQTGRIGQQRAESDGRTDATGTDLAIAAPFALGSAALERVGLGAVTGKVAGKIGGRVVNSAAGRIATGALGEAGTEAAQSTVEYAGGSVGTQAGFDPTVALDQAVQGAVGGGVTGGVLSVGSESVRQVRRITSRLVPSGEVQAAVSEAIQPTEEDINSPLSTADIVAGRATVAAGMATGRADAILAQNGMPEIGARVSIDQGDGTVASGVIEDAFAIGDSAGVKIKLDDGSLLEEHFADLRDAGVVINRQALETAADIDAELARRATEALQRSDEVPPPAPLLDETPPVEQPAVVEATPQQVAPENTVSTDQAIAGFKARTRRAESGGRDNAQNPRSSAQGRYQFTDGTWIATYRAEFGDGDSNQQILAKKFDANLQERLMDRLTRDNASGLKRAGLPVTEGSLYLAHFAGIGGATKLMTANPGASVESVLGQRVVNANPFLRGMSANEVVAWAAGKMGGKAPAVAPGQEAATPIANPATDDIDPYAMALDAYRQEMDTAPASPADVGPMVAQEQEPRIGEPPAAVGQTAQEPSPPPGAQVNTGEIPQDAGGAPAAVSSGFSGDVRGEPINKLWTRFSPESGTLGIARKEMPQIAAENRGAMVNFLTARGVSNQEAVVPAASLKPTQAEFSEQKVRKAANYKGGDRAILVSSDGYLLDGHHQWMAARDAGKDVRVIRLDAPIEDLIRTIADMPSAKTASGKDVAAPVKRARQSIDTNSVAITPTGREVPVEYAVVDASSLITSHTQDGYVNPDFPAEKQPRDRSRGTSQAQIAEIAAKLDPRLLGISVKASDGAPIISPEGVVESGNGRALAIARAYQNGGPQADAYRRFIAEQGFNTEGMVQPVLVRVRSRDMAQEDVLAFTREANQRDTAGFSATEQAVSDAAALPDSALGLYRGGDIDMAGNREFVRKFMDAVVPATERANMVSADGSISQDAMRRIGAALLQRAYSNENLVAKLSESTDSNIKAIGGALADVSGAWASMRAAAKDGTIDPAMDITDSLNEAVELVDKARRDGVKVADLVNQRDIFSGEAVPPLTEAMLRLMFRNPSFTQPVGRAKLAERLNWYVEQAMLSSAEAGLFGPADVVAPGDVLATAQEKFGEQQTGRQEGLFSRPEQADAGDGGGVREGGDPGDGRGEGVPQQPRNEGGAEEQLNSTPPAAPNDPVATLTGDELGAVGDILDLERKARAWFKANLRLKSVTSSDGVLVGITRRGEGKIKGGERILRAVPAIPALIENGTHSGPFEPSEKWAAKGAVAAHHYTGDVTIGGETSAFGVLVQEFADGRRFYSLTDQPEMDVGSRSSLTEGRQAVARVEITPDANINLFFADEMIKTERRSNDQVKDVAPALRQRLAALNLDDKVTLAIRDVINGDPRVAGSYRDRVITVAMASSQSPEMTLNHEVVHAAKALGLFRSAEWNALSKAARADRKAMTSIGKRYPDLTEESQVEEAIADRYMQWVAGRQEKGFIARAFDRVRDFLRGLGQALRGEGFTTADAAMRALEGGRMGRREVSEARDGTIKEMVVYHGTPHDFDEFSLNAIGTGEGAQVYGWGLYFAGKKAIAEHYRDKLSQKGLVPVKWNGKALRDINREWEGRDVPDEVWNAIQAIAVLEYEGDVSRTIQKLRERYGKDGGRAAAWLEENQDDIEITKPGRLYEVDIPEESEYLLWDAPLSEQPEVVRPALEAVKQQLELTGEFENYMDQLNAEWSDVTGGELVKKIFRRMQVDDTFPVDMPEEAALALEWDGNADKAGALWLRSLGVAGIKYLDGGSRAKGDGSYNYVLFDDSRAKVLAKYSIPEALPDAGHNFDDYSATVSPQTRSLLEGISGGDLQATQTKLDDWRVWLQDKMLYVRRLQDTLRGATEGDTPDSQNPYLAEELMTGRAGARLEALAEETIEPLFAAMHDTKTTVDELETYLYARHAAERNAHIAKINPEFTPGEGSGMTDIQARAILARVARDGKADTMNALSAYVDRMLSQAVQTRVDAGLLSAEEAAAWADTYKHYVPLRGKREVEGDAKAQKERVNSMSGQSVRGKESKRAFGRRSEADSILAYSILQAEEAIIRAEKNRVATAFLNLAEANPDDGLWTINKVVSKQRINPTTGLAERYVVNQLTAEDAPYTVSAKVDGKERRVTMNRDNPLAVKVAEAMRNLEDPKFNGFMAAAATFNRYFSAINTRFNPTFVITNAVRDLQTAAVIGQQFDIPGFTSKIVRDYKGALTASKNGTGEWSRWRREWELSGGKVYYNQTGDLDQIKKDLQRHAKRLSQPNVAAKVWTSTFDALEAMNEAVERAVRLAVYKNAREAGKSKPQAASMARNITVNFTRKGRLGPAFNAFFAFFNASTQGSANLIMAATKSRKVRSVMGGFIVAGFLSDVLNSMLSGDDDDGEAFWDKLPDYEKSRNIVLMLPDGDNGQAIKIPLAYGLNALFGLGRNASAMMRGALTPGAAIGASALEFADAFNPIGGGGSWLNIVAPTALDPFVDVTMNADFTGKPIQPEQNPFEPDVTPSSNYYNGVPGWAKSVAKGLNSATGGDDVLPGAVSVSPEVVDYAAGFLIGGAGRFVKDISTIAMSPFDPEAEIELRDIPFAKQVAASKSSSVDKSRYYKRVNEVKAVLDHAKEYQDRGDREALAKFVDDNRDVGQMGGITKEASKLMSGIRKARNEASFQHELGNIDDAAYAAVVKQARENEEVVISAYNKRWMKTVEGDE